ncbi:hypothetical protein GCM10009740_21350 [Terrabacter terrae]|uniref:SnoaL-like domain-containing protein n=1 Tax=Terrabacter terrae TaxID=318434 RepID=A0ABP5FPD0_9MICO
MAAGRTDPGSRDALTSQALTRHDRSAASADVVDLHADDAVLTTPEGAFTGRNELRARFARELDALSDVRSDVIGCVEAEDVAQGCRRAQDKGFHATLRRFAGSALSEERSGTAKGLPHGKVASRGRAVSSPSGAGN